MAEHAIDVEKLNVSYKSIQSYAVKRSLLKLKKSTVKKVHALQDVSFYVNKGEVLGIIGRNGSGKSTLLKALAGVFQPDSGTIDLHGNTVSLLSLGTGFNQEVSGRENIFLNGMLLGFSMKFIREKLDEIIEFSEIGEFIDMPVRTYSSGMSSKLGFAIAIFLETDIFLIDEILSVGDTKFRKKSFEKLKSIISDENRTVLLVSHNEKQIRDLCDRVVWLDHGKVVEVGDTEELVDRYLEL